MIGMLRVVVLIGLVLFGLAGTLMGGAVFTAAFLTNEIVTVSTGPNGPNEERVLRMENPDLFWQRALMLGILPMGLGVLSIVIGWRGLRRA